MAGVDTNKDMWIFHREDRCREGKVKFARNNTIDADLFYVDWSGARLIVNRYSGHVLGSLDPLSKGNIIASDDYFISNEYDPQIPTKFNSLPKLADVSGIDGQGIF